MLVTITDFALERGQDRDTVNAWIRNHPEVNDACIRKGKDKLIDTDSEAFRMLEKKYPLQVLPVMEDKESQQKVEELRYKLDEAKDRIIVLQDLVHKKDVELLSAEKERLQIESTKDKEITILEGYIQDAKKELAIVNQEKLQVEESLREERSRKLTWKERLLGRKEV